MLIPHKLYKYKSISTEQHVEWAVEILLKDTIYFCSRTEFNDPFDCRPRFRVAATVEQLKEYIASVYERHAPHLDVKERYRLAEEDANRWRTNPAGELKDFTQKFYKQSIDKYGICSLSADPHNPLMWAHYADSHRGICLEFDTSVQHSPFSLADKVIYQDEPPKFDLIGDDENLTEMWHALLATKGLPWSYEQEWRVIDRNGVGLRKFHSQCLTAIVIGALCSDTQKKRIIEIVRTRNSALKIYHARLSDRHYRVDLLDF